MYDIGAPRIPGYVDMTLAEREAARLRQYGQFIVRHPSGGTEGRDPRQIPRIELETLHEPVPVLKAIRAKCLDCCCGSESEVRRCTAINCPLWPFRMGANPWRAPPSEERRAAAVEAGRRLANLRTIQGKNEPDGADGVVLAPEPERLPAPTGALSGATGLAGP